jgi:hypothetical protein
LFLELFLLRFAGGLSELEGGEGGGGGGFGYGALVFVHVKFVLFVAVEEREVVEVELFIWSCRSRLCCVLCISLWLGLWF